MENIVSTSELIRKTNKIFGLPYKGKVKKSYFVYFSLFGILSLLVYISSLFVIINLGVNNHYHITSNLNNINITITPLVNILLITISLLLLLIAPNRIHHSTKQSSVMFYVSFWMLVVSTMLNSQLQLNYTNHYASSSFYNWLNIAFIKIVIIISVISLFFVEVFFWIMRRKFTFMPNDYEIYMMRIEKKRDEKAINSEKKLIKKHKKLNEKIKKTQLKDKKKLEHKLKKGTKDEK